MRMSEKLIYCTTKITTVIDGGGSATGSGFFMDFNADLENGTCQSVIITNKHVVEGAKKIIFSVCRATEENEPLDRERFTITLSDFKIIGHPDPDVDLCAISTATMENLVRQENVNLFKARLSTDLIPTDREISESSVMEDIVMIGYPNGLEDSYNNKPIIRKGIISTHMKFDYNGKKEFLVDMACFPGSSGSPIFFCDAKSYISGDSVVFGSRCRLLGVLYAGPQHTSTGSIVFENISTNPKAIVTIPNNLGIVIKASRIKELEDLMRTM